jgi:ribonuclease J
MPKLSSFLSHKQTSNQPVANLDFSKQDTPLRVVPLGGLEEVGANMTFLEYGDDILVIDAGLVFAGGELYGVDYLIPDTAYLRKNKKKIRAILITHGHLDHIGALKHVLADLDWPVVYSSPLTIGLIKKTLEEEKILGNFKYKLVNPDTDVLKFGCYTVEFFHVNHNIPESMGMSIHTPK